MILFGFRRPSCSPLRQHWCTKSQSSFSTASGASKQYHYNPAVVFSPPKNRPLLSPLHLKGTASILAPQWRHLSPCLGAALACSPFTGNLMRLGQHIDNCDDISASSISSSVLKHSAKLANLLFFQLIRESPIHITKNKSMPAAYLSPSLIGSVLAMSSSYTTATTRSNDVSMKIRKTLKDDYGIRSNRIDGNQWTGVSMARWMELFPMGVVSASTATTRSDKHALARNPLVSGIWLVALWETAQSKLCLLEFLKAYDRYVVTSNNSDKRSSIFCKNNKWVQAILHDPVAKTEWADQAYHETNDLSQEEAQASLDKLLFYNEKQKNGNFNPTFDPMSDSEHACALEVVCAHYSLQQQPINSKCVAPAGYYGFDGGDAKPGPLLLFL